jgi:hypothetical protein
MEASHFALGTEGGRKQRIKHYEERVFGHWHQFAFALKLMLEDAVWEQEDLEAYCQSTFGAGSERMRKVIRLQEAFRAETAYERGKEWVEKFEKKTEEAKSKKPMSSTERVKAYRERKKAERK